MALEGGEVRPMMGDDVESNCIDTEGIRGGAGEERNFVGIRKCEYI